MREYTEAELTMAICIQLMKMHQFPREQRRNWEIWASKSQACPECFSAPYQPCLNLTDVRIKRSDPRPNLNPHSPRVDWNQLLNGLKHRGYYRASVERNVRGWSSSD